MPWISQDDLKWLRDRVATLEREQQEAVARHETAIVALAEKHSALMAQESAAWREAIKSARLASATRISELERRVDWQADMLLRRAQTFPVPPKEEENKVPTPPTVASRFSPDDIGKAQAIRDDGLRLQSEYQCPHDPPHTNRECVRPTDAEIDGMVKTYTGLTLRDLRAAEVEIANEMQESQSVS